MRKIYRLVTVMVIALIGLTGCNDRKKVDYHVSEEEIITTEAVPEMETEVKYELTGGNYRITVDATIELPENYTNCSVISISKDDFTDEDIKPMADKIFDEGSHFLYMPYTQEQIDFLNGKLSEILENTSDDELAWAINEELFTLRYYEEYCLDENEDLVIEDYKFYRVKDEYISGSAEIDLCVVMGTIDGELYKLVFDNIDTGSKMSLSRFRDRYTKQYISLADSAYEISMYGNICSYSKEEAVELATEYIEGLGYTDYAVNMVNSLYETKWDYEPYEQTENVNGYRICFGRNYKNYTVAYTDKSATTYDYQGVIDEFWEAIVVYVTDDGVIRFEVVNPRKFEEELSETTSMLSYEKIETIVNEFLTESREESQNQLYCNVTGIKLAYGEEMSADGEIALVPMWIYYYSNDTGSMFYIHELVIINAIDGSIYRSPFF
ncbi:MAG: hypothetical protein IJX12_00400 [Lachnospiraceae bacterium]|nr:hypothetical protein [Lachnospiraceae bacterium]